jgi:hypothetical protein
MYSSATAANTRKRIAGKSIQEYHYTQHHLPLVKYLTSVMSTSTASEINPTSAEMQTVPG